MEDLKHELPPVRFGIFEVNLQSGELRKQGYRIKLQEQPFQVLAMLLERPGEIVTRESIQKQLWPANTFVDFERGLNRAINKLREALGDDTDRPRFIETLPRRGYRFLVPVETETNTAPAEQTPPAALAVQANLPLNLEAGVSTASIRKRQSLPWTIAGLCALIAVFSYWKQSRSPAISRNRPLLQFEVEVGPNEFSEPAISPDGMRIAFVSNGSLTIRRFDQNGATRLAGTEGAFAPFFSPDGQWVAFFAKGKLQKMVLDGGAPTVLCDAPEGGGGNWGDDGNIVAALTSTEGGSGLFRIPAAGGAPKPLTDSTHESSAPPMRLWPQALPRDKGVLFTAKDGSAQSSLRVLTQKDGRVKTLIAHAAYGRYLPGGYLLYYQDGTIFAAPMDLERLELTGPGVPFVTEVSPTPGTDKGDFDVSNSGTLVYRRGAGKNFALSWLYPNGKTEAALPGTARFVTPRLSPDGLRLATAILEGEKQNLWVYDFRRETWTRVTSDGAPALLPVWTPDGEFIAFRLGDGLAWIKSDGSGSIGRLAGVSANVGPSSFSADGKWLALWPLQPGSDLWTSAVDRAAGSLQLRQPHPLLQQAGSKGAPVISPDRRWVAYTSNESGRFEIYVIPFSPLRNVASAKWPISNSGGVDPTWSRAGQELLYQTFDNHIEAVSYKVKGEMFVPEKPRLWTPTRLADTGIFNAFDIAPDGRRVIALLHADDFGSATLVRVLLNVDSELRRRASQTITR